MDRRTYDRRQTEPYIGFVHASLYADLVASNPRGVWQNAYRRARRAGMAYLPPRWILAKFPSRPMPAEIGHIEGFRFIEAKIN